MRILPGVGVFCQFVGGGGGEGRGPCVADFSPGLVAHLGDFRAVRIGGDGR